MNSTAPVFEIEPGVHLATLSAVRESRAIDEIDPGTVVSLTADEPPESTAHHPLVDGLNYQPRFDDAVDAARRGLVGDDPVIVHCRAAVSRSTAVLATALAAESDRSLAATFGDIRDARPEADPRPPLRWHARHYLGEADIRESIGNSPFDVDPETVATERAAGSPVDGDIDDALPGGIGDALERHDQ